MRHESVWSATAIEPKSFPSLAGELSADVAVIGGGISGLTCAMLLAQGGKKVVLLEARRLGLGTTGNSTGNLYGTVDLHLESLVSTWGIETTSRVVRSRLSAIDFIEKTSREFSLDCDFKRVPFHYFTEDAAGSAKSFFESERAAAMEVGLKAAMLAEAPLPFKNAGCLQIQGQAQIHPLNYIRALSMKLPDGIEVFENSAVLEFDAKQGAVVCERGRVKADKFVFATHVPKGVDEVQLRLEPIREHGVTALLESKPFEGIFWRIDKPKRSIRTVTRNGKTYVLAIGASFKTGHKEDTPHENEILEDYLRSRVSLGGERSWWAAQSYRSADKLPFIGEQKPGVYMLTGFSADGLVYGTLGANIIADEILGRQNEFTDLYRVHRPTLLKSAKAIALQGLDSAYQYLKDLPKFGTQPLDALKNGEGAIVEQNGEKWAAYKHDDGKLECVSAVCTHMKCIVTFNKAEKTWDCPCHASRFALDGSVIEGPALTALERKKP